MITNRDNKSFSTVSSVHTSNLSDCWDPSSYEKTLCSRVIWT